jgi:hypothetical protein
MIVDPNCSSFITWLKRLDLQNNRCLRVNGLQCSFAFPVMSSLFHDAVSIYYIAANGRDWIGKKWSWPNQGIIPTCT